MKVIIDSCTCADLDQGKNCELTINSAYLKDSKLKIHLPELTAYPPFINSHDHLVGNWFPRAGDNHPYATTDIWVEEMKQSASFQERNRFLGRAKYKPARFKRYLSGSMTVLLNLLKVMLHY